MQRSIYCPGSSMYMRLLLRRTLVLKIHYGAFITGRKLSCAFNQEYTEIRDSTTN